MSMHPDASAAIACAYADLKGVLEAYTQGLTFADLDIDSIRDTLGELEIEFPNICQDSGPEDDADPGDMDGDAVSALASAGWGTDEDYGVCE